MIDLLKEWDRWLLLLINSCNNSLWDFIMYWISDRFIWIPLYIYILYIIIKIFRKNALIIILILLLLIVFTDQIAYHLFKNIFQRPRPCHETFLQGILHLVNNKCGGAYGFISSHAANTFAFAIYVYLHLYKRIKYLPTLMIIWSLAIGYSRIYLGVHYPADVICGIIFGGISGYVFYLLSVYFLKKSSYKA